MVIRILLCAILTCLFVVKPAYADSLKLPYFYQNAGAKVYENQSFAIHRFGNMPTLDISSGQFTTEREVCMRDIAESREKSDVLVAVAILNLPADAAMTEDWLWKGFREVFLADAVPQLCPNAFVAYVDLYIRGWAMTQDGRPYEVGEFGQGSIKLTNVNLSRGAFRVGPVSWSSDRAKGFGLGLQYLSSPIVSLRLRLDESFSFQSVGVSSNWSHLDPPTEFQIRFSEVEREPMGHVLAQLREWVTPFAHLGNESDMYSYYSHFGADGSFLGRVETALEQAERHRISRAEFEKMMVARDVALARKTGTANNLSYSLEWALSRIVEQWPSLDRRAGAPRSSACHFGSTDNFCKNLALQNDAIITILPR